MFWPWCLAGLVSVIVDLDQSEANFYTTSMQVIPVLFVAQLLSAGLLGIPGYAPDEEHAESPHGDRWFRVFEWVGWLASIFTQQALLAEGAAIYGTVLHIKSTFLVVGIAVVILTQLVVLGNAALWIFWTRTTRVIEEGIAFEVVDGSDADEGTGERAASDPAAPKPELGLPTLRVQVPRHPVRIHLRGRRRPRPTEPQTEQPQSQGPEAQESSPDPRS
jgi:hypothetical protein